MSFYVESYYICVYVRKVPKSSFQLIGYYISNFYYYTAYIHRMTITNKTEVTILN